MEGPWRTCGVRVVRCALNRIERPVPPAADGAVLECAKRHEAACPAAAASGMPRFGARVQHGAPGIARADVPVGQDSHGSKRQVSLTRRRVADERVFLVHGNRSTRAISQRSVRRRLSFACDAHVILHNIGHVEHVRPRLPSASFFVARVRNARRMSVVTIRTFRANRRAAAGPRASRWFPSRARLPASTAGRS